MYNEHENNEIDCLVRRLYEFISPDQYLHLNRDVANAEMHPIYHFTKYGWRENRFIAVGYQSDDLISNNPDLSQSLRRVQNNVDMEYLENLFDKNNKMPNRNKIRFVGYVEAKLGIGVAARHTISCYNKISDKFSIYPYNYNAVTRFESSFMPEHYNTHQNFSINIFELGLDNASIALDKVTNGFIDKSYNILKLYWELSTLPEEKIPDINRYDEVWVPSKFVYDCISKVFNKPIYLIPPFIDTEFEYISVRKSLGLSKSIFYYLCMFDYNSSIERKNPHAVIKAFKAAFPEDYNNVGLIIKSNKPPTNGTTISSIIKENGGDNRIRVIEEYMQRSELLSLIKDCDCYVSLHRSEGYGMVIAEAIRLGRPVIATNYSGNVDFMNSLNSHPVEYRLINIDKDQYFLGDGKEWAQPIHESAVKQFLLAYKTRKSIYRYLTSKFSAYRKNILSAKRIAYDISSRVEAIKAKLDNK